MDMQTIADVIEPSLDAPSEQFTWAQIVARYPNEWVILVDMVDENATYCGGRVVAHNRVRDSLLDVNRAAVRRYGESGRFWTGEHGNPRTTWMRRALGLG